MIQKDAIELIQKTAVHAEGQRIYTVEAEPDYVYYILQPDGTLKQVIASEPPVDSYHDTIESLIDHVGPQAQPPAIWCSADSIVAADLGNRDKARFDLTNSEPYRTLCEWDGKMQSYDHVGVYTLFRTVFHGCLDAHPGLLNDIRKVDVQKAQQAQGEVSRSAVSMSRKLVAEAAGADKLPEILHFTMPIFEQLGAPVRVTVDVAFDLEPQSEKFRFYVLPGQIKRAEFEAEAWLEAQVRKVLEAKGYDVPVYRGIP